MRHRDWDHLHPNLETTHLEGYANAGPADAGAMAVGRRCVDNWPPLIDERITRIAESGFSF